MIKQPNRLISLDVFRGLTIMGMILVNNPGSWSYVYKPLRHAAWHGWTPTDLIFPFFLFIVGVAMSFSLKNRLDRGESQGRLFFKIARRSIILFVLGLFLNEFPFFRLAEMRIPGVLQRIALCYFFASVIVLKFNKKMQFGLTISFLLSYMLFMKYIPVPGFGSGILEPKGNLCWYIDNLLLSGHTWKYAPAKGFDPEGVLSTLPAIATAMLGVFTGDWLRSSREPLEKVSGLFVFGNIMLVLGIILNIWIPINKNLWTSSYVIFTAGMALHFLAVCYWLIDIKGYQRWAKPFIIFGSNAILVYFLSGIVARLLNVIHVSHSGNKLILKQFIFQNGFVPWAGNMNGSLFFALTYVLLWLSVMWIFYRKKIFIKI